MNFDFFKIRKSLFYKLGIINCLIFFGCAYFLNRSAIESLILIIVLMTQIQITFVLYRKYFDKTNIHPAVIWFTGFSGSGKTTLSEHLIKRLTSRGHQVEHLDGDHIRQVFPATGFSREERNQHVKRVGFLASRLEKAGVIVVSSLISPFQESRDFIRGLCDNFIEIHISTPLEVCEQRDPKGLYKKARSGEIKNFTGIDDAYEPPKNPELQIDTSTCTLDEAVSIIEKYLR